MKRSHTLFSENELELTQQLIQTIIDYSIHAYDDTEYILTSTDPLFKTAFDQLLQAKAGNVDKAKLSFFMESVDEDIMPFLKTRKIDASLQDDLRCGLQNCYCDAQSCKGNNSEEPDKQMKNHFTNAVRKLLDTTLNSPLNPILKTR